MIEWLLETPIGTRVEARVFSRRESLCAPHLLDIEVAQVLRRYAMSRFITETRAQEALQDMIDFPISRYPHDVLLARVWELRTNLAAYDAAYVALAEALEAPLLTCDRRIALAPLHRARVEVI